MNYLFRFANFEFLYLFLPLLICLIIYRMLFYKPTSLRHTLGSFFVKNNSQASNFYKNIFIVLRIIILLIVGFLIAKPQIADLNSKINVEGIDIVLIMDVSASMLCFDDQNDRRPRIDIAKEEAIRFINKRENDPIGLVFFGKYALSKCPLTLDKKMLSEIINDFKIGEIDFTETCLSTSIATAANRLKHSKAKSKIIILLTDGEPTQSDIPENIAIDIAKKLGIKIYTIGIGNDFGGFTEHPFAGVIPCGFKLNEKLLTKIAQETNGKYFNAKNAEQMRTIYDTIDKLEKTKVDSNLFNQYNDFFLPLIFLILILVFLEQFLYSFIWFQL